MTAALPQPRPLDPVPVQRGAHRALACAARRRWALLTAWTVACAMAHLGAHGAGWHYFATGADVLFTRDGLHLYATHAVLQAGPVSFAAVAPLTHLLPARLALAAGMAVMAALGLALLRQAEHLIPVGRDRTMPVLLAGLVLVPVWSELAVRWAHPDDALALLLAVTALRLHRDQRWTASAIALGLAVDTKPWAIAFCALIVLTPGRTQRATCATWTAAVIAAAWLPFYLADSATLTAAGTFHIPVAADSVIHLLGATDTTTPAWCRPAQLALGLTLTGIAVARRRPEAVLVVGICARMLLDPATKSYYDTGLIAATAIYDLATAATAIPALTLAAATLIWTPHYLLPTRPDLRAAIRLGALIGIAAWTLLERRQLRSGRVNTPAEQGVANRQTPAEPCPRVDRVSTHPSVRVRSGRRCQREGRTTIASVLVRIGQQTHLSLRPSPKEHYMARTRSASASNAVTLHKFRTALAVCALTAGVFTALPAVSAYATAGPVSRDCQSANPGNTSFNQGMQCRLQEGPAGHNGYTGPVDGAMGTNSWKGVQRFLAAYYGYRGPVDGAPGPNTYAALQRWATDRGGYRGPIDGAMGPNSWRGVDYANEYDYYAPGARL